MRRFPARLFLACTWLAICWTVRAVPPAAPIGAEKELEAARSEKALAEEQALKIWRDRTLRGEQAWGLAPGKRVKLLVEGPRVKISDGKGDTVIILADGESVEQVHFTPDGLRLMLLLHKVEAMETHDVSVAYSRLVLVSLNKRGEWVTKTCLPADAAPMNENKLSIGKIVSLSKDYQTADLMVTENAVEADTVVPSSVTRRVNLTTGAGIIDPPKKPVIAANSSTPAPQKNEPVTPSKATPPPKEEPPKEKGQASTPTTMTSAAEPKPEVKRAELPDALWKAVAIQGEAEWKLEPEQTLKFVLEDRRVWLSDAKGSMVTLFSGDECVAQVQPSADHKRMLILLKKAWLNADGAIEYNYSRVVVIWLSTRGQWQTRNYLAGDRAPMNVRQREITKVLNFATDHSSAEVEFGESADTTPPGPVTYTTRWVTLKTGEGVEEK